MTEQLPHTNWAQIDVFLDGWAAAVTGGAVWNDAPEEEVITQTLWSAMERWPERWARGYGTHLLAAAGKPAELRPEAPADAVSQARRAVILLFCRPWLRERDFRRTYASLELPGDLRHPPPTPSKPRWRSRRQPAHTPVHLKLQTAAAIRGSGSEAPSAEH